MQVQTFPTHRTVMEDLDWRAFAATMTGTVVPQREAREKSSVGGGGLKESVQACQACPCQGPAEAGFALWRVR